jgi:hypothetical protein
MLDGTPSAANACGPAVAESPVGSGVASFREGQPFDRFLGETTMPRTLTVITLLLLSLPVIAAPVPVPVTNGGFEQDLDGSRVGVREAPEFRHQGHWNVQKKYLAKGGNPQTKHN